MATLRGLYLLQLLVLCVSAAPVDNDVTIDDDPKISKSPLLLESSMFDSIEVPLPVNTNIEDEGKEATEKESSARSDPPTSDEGAEGGSTYFSDYGSLPAWYLDELSNSGNDNLSEAEEYRKYKYELNQLLLDVKLYQVYHSIKTLKSVLDELIADEQNEETDGQISTKDQPRDHEENKSGMKDQTDIGVLKDLHDKEVLIAKQLENLKQKERKPRRSKRDLRWGDDTRTNFGESEWNDGKPNLRWMIKYDDENDDRDEFNDVTGTNNEFDITKQQIRDMLSSFDPYSEGGLPLGNEVNINVGDQTVTQDVWYPSNPAKRAPRQKVDRNFLDRLPTLEGLRKRRRTFIPLRRSWNNQPLIHSYGRYNDDELTPGYQHAFINNQLSKLARKLAQNSSPLHAETPTVWDYTNDPMGDVNMWFENNPMYNIGVDENIGDTFGWQELDLPMGSPDEVEEADQRPNFYGWGHVPRLHRRSRIVEEPSLPGPYQGYFMEGQLWHDVMEKRGGSALGMQPKNLKIGGPNAWGNFIFINDKDMLPSDGKWLSQSFGDNIGIADDQPGQIQTEGAWIDGSDATDDQGELTEKEKAWVRRILGFQD